MLTAVCIVDIDIAVDPNLAYIIAIANITAYNYYSYSQLILQWIQT